MIEENINGKSSIEKVKELFDKNFFVSNYQRGYRWNRENVQDLLEDLNEYKEANQNLFENIDLEKTILDDKHLNRDISCYCLQPLVVKNMTKEEKEYNNLIAENDFLELIDGQQRLTTIYILLKFLFDKTNLSPRMYEIFYQTKGNMYLNNITEADKDKEIDNYYLYEAKQEIIEWFNKNDVEEYFYLKILYIVLYCCEFILYEIDYTENSVDVFTRINTGKIALTNAELIKALLLKDNNSSEKNEIYLKQLEIANEWDNIEATLQNKEFWYFLNNEDSKSYSTKIEFLFEVGIIDQYKIKDNNSYDVFKYFYKKSKNNSSMKFIEEIWNNKVRKYFMTLKEWFKDKDLYHLVGYLIIADRIDKNTDNRRVLKDLLTNSETMSKTEFKNDLKLKMKAHLEYDFKGNKESAIDYLSRKYEKLSYEDNAEERRKNKQLNNSEEKRQNKPLIRKILLAFNIITYMNSCNKDIRFPFYRFKINSGKNGKKQDWDIEHIHPQNSEVPQNDEDIKNYFNIMQVFFEKALEKEKSKAKEIENSEKIERIDYSYFLEIINQQKDLFENKNLNKDKFQEIYQEINDKFGDQMVISNREIGNMVLLSAEMNRSYKNAPFAVKRGKIVEWDRDGEFIPICSKNAFLKYYSEDMEDMVNYWKRGDIDGHYDKMINTIAEFLLFEENENEMQL